MTEAPELIKKYRDKIAAGEIHDDPAQRMVMERLNLLSRRLVNRPEGGGLFSKALFGWGREKVTMDALEGLYIYGSVGRGKSMLMDMFAEHVGDLAWRIHFHEFMQYVHSAMDKARAANRKDPLREVALEIARKHDVLCLDEMQVENIADAMIVGRLFEALFGAGAVLVTTSNRHPEELYAGGLNRHRFTPFIDEISKFCEIISLDGEHDYRQHEQGQSRYFYPLTPATKRTFEAEWTKVAGRVSAQEIELGKRKWLFDFASEHAVKVSFRDACEGARGARDYAKLAERFQAVFIDEIPKLNKQNTSAATRFVTLIDVLYEARTVLYLRLEDAPEKLHDDENTRFVWERTLSRLTEMSKAEWVTSSDI